MFICWSGPRAEKLAELVRGFLSDVIPSVKGHVFSSPHIEKGARWFEEVLSHLEAAEVGLVCLTAENLRSPWLHFEAGALLNGLHRRVATGGSEAISGERIFTYLHGVTPASLSGPLAQYQSTETTRTDTRNLVRALSRILEPESTRHRDLFDRHWPAFERELARLHVPVWQLLPQLDRWFRRKTFEEPLPLCTDQNWLGRYDGARQTHDRLSEQLASVRQACPRYQADLYDCLLTLLESYAMDIKALLVRAPRFELGSDGRLEIPAGTLQACEDRRERIKEVVCRLLDPLSVAATDEAARFWLSDSFDLRKMMVHRCEHAVRAALNGEGRMEIPDVVEAGTLFESVWDLDRILGYLAMEYLHRDAGEALDALCHAGGIELERLRAFPGRTAMPLYYACRALAAAAAGRRKRVEPSLRDSIKVLVDDVRALVDGSRPAPGAEPTLDRGGQLRRVLRAIDRRLLPDAPDIARPLPPVGHPSRSIRRRGRLPVQPSSAT